MLDSMLGTRVGQVGEMVFKTIECGLSGIRFKSDSQLLESYSFYCSSTPFVKIRVRLPYNKAPFH